MDNDIDEVNQIYLDMDGNLHPLSQLYYLLHVAAEQKGDDQVRWGTSKIATSTNDRVEIASKYSMARTIRKDPNPPVQTVKTGGKNMLDRFPLANHIPHQQREIPVFNFDTYGARKRTNFMDKMNKESPLTDKLKKAGKYATYLK